MACNKPFLKQVKKSGILHFLPIPCGYCAACRRDKINMWSDRITFEADTIGKPSAFVTLTYEDSSLPLGGVSKEDVQNWLKRLRYYSGVKFKYYLASEYGEENKLNEALPNNQRWRPHYHVILLGFDIGKRSNRLALDKSWKFGFIQADYLIPARVRYTLKYVSKELKNKKLNDVDYINAGLEPLFHLSSKGIGRDWFFRPSRFDKVKSWLLRKWKASPFTALLSRFVTNY